MGSPFLNLLPPKKQVAVSAFDFSQRLFQDPKPEVFIPATGSAGAGPVLDSVGKQRYAGFSDGSLWERLFLSPLPSVRLLQRCFPMLSRMASVFDSFLRARLVMDGADSFVLFMVFAGRAQGSIKWVFDDFVFNHILLMLFPTVCQVLDHVTTHFFLPSSRIRYLDWRSSLQAKVDSPSSPRNR